MDKVFLDKGNEPTTDALKKVMGECYRFYDEILKMAEGFESIWTFYKGWSYKLFYKSKALCYISPGKEAFEVKMAIRENEKTLLLKGDLSDDVEDMIEKSESIAEGYPLRFLVRNKMSFNRLKRVLTLIIPERLS